MKVFVLVGTSGAGKSTVLDKIDIPEVNPLKLHTMVKPSNYMTLQNHLMLAKWNYIANWYNAIYSCYRDGVEVILSDRTPIEVAAYLFPKTDVKTAEEEFKKVRHSILNALIRSNEEMKSEWGIDIRYIYLYEKSDVNYDRMINRKHNYNTKNYGENDHDYFNKTYEFYEEQRNNNLWHYSIINNSLDKTVEKISRIIRDETKK